MTSDTPISAVLTDVDGTLVTKDKVLTPRALQDAALATWRGDPQKVEAAQQAFYHRARCNSLAALGAYGELEEEHVDLAAPHHPAEIETSA